MPLHRAAFVLIGAMSLLAPAVASGGDHFLTVGGGYQPSGNQASLEKNVLYFQRVLRDQGLGSAPHTVFFADGTDPARDLQFDDSSNPAGRLNRLLARIMGPERNASFAYRSSSIPGVTGGASVAYIDRYFNNDAWRLTPADRLVFYFTGHGGKGRGKDPQNTVMYLWNNQQLVVREFAQRLDKVPAQTPVVLVMVQCYSGGFANVIFENGDPRGDMDVHDRCGFFATVHDRMAAGCTPDIDEADYQEYSSFFWAAINGVDRTGKRVDSADYNGDGRVSFAEAHAFALIHEHSVDVSVKTSDVFLRRFSSFKPEPHAGGVRSERSPMLASSPYAKLVAAASPADHAVLESLSRELGLTGSDRAKGARDKATDCTAQKSKLEGESKRVSRDFQSVRRGIADELKLRWPELDSPWNPAVPRLLETEGDKITRAIERHRDYSQFLKLAAQIDAVDRRAEDQEKQWAKCQRLTRTLENVALEWNLPACADDEVIHRYHRLLESEGRSLK